jgi:hypothetical protein
LAGASPISPSRRRDDRRWTLAREPDRHAPLRSGTLDVLLALLVLPSAFDADHLEGRSTWLIAAHATRHVEARRKRGVREGALGLRQPGDQRLGLVWLGPVNRV